MKKAISLLITALWASFAYAQTSAGVPSPIRVCAECIRKNMGFLASDDLRGRGSATEDEKKAAAYIGSQLKAYGIQPAGDDGGFLQRVTLIRDTVTAPPQIVFDTPVKTTWTFGKEFTVPRLPGNEFSGKLKQFNPNKPDEQINKGEIAVCSNCDQKSLTQIYNAGAVAVLLFTKHFKENAALPKLRQQIEGVGNSGMGQFAMLSVNETAYTWLANIPDGTMVHFNAPTESGEKKYTWNAIGILRGSDPDLQHAAVLFSAHLDHLGVGTPVNGDSIYNGADDDASGTSAVLEIARVLGASNKPRRTVIFALFGSEELGGLGSTYFREHPPVPLQEIAANLEFEMIGRPDPAVKADTVWLTGWERSNLGPVLAEHGAKLVGDPHPDEDFFTRSDNYVLAKKGVVAQTISSYGLHSDYHQPNDDLAHIDFDHMDKAIGSLLEPVEWLVNSDFKPQWNPGGQP